MRLPLLPVGFLFLLLATPMAVAQDKLKVLDHPVLTVNSVCNAEGEGNVDLHIRNDGNSKITLNPAQLSATDPTTSSSPAKTLNVRVMLAKPDKLELAPHEIATVQASVSKIFEDGDWVSSIENDGTEIGRLRITRNSPNFAISLDSAAPASPELTFEKSAPGHFWVRNADPVPYQVTWEYSVNGVSVGSDHPITVPAKAQQQIVFGSPNQWFRQVYVLKDQSYDGYLIIRLASYPAGKQDCDPIIKTFGPIKTHLVHRAGLGSDILADLEIFLFLGLGAVFSLFLNFMLPDQMRKIRMKDQLGKLGAQIAGLSYDLASRLRVLVGLEQRLIGERLKNLSWTDSEFATEMQNIGQAMERLRTRLQFLTTLGMARTSFEEKCSDVLPPTMIFELESLFEKVVKIGKKADPSDDDVKSAQTLIKTIEGRLDAGILNNSDFAKDLQARITQCKADFDSTSGRIGNTPTCKRIAGVLPYPFKLILNANPASVMAATNQLQVDSQIDLDLALFQLDVVGQYVELVDGMPAADALTQKRVSHEAELVELLERHSTEALHGAHLLIRELNNGYFQDDIENAMKSKSFAMKVSPAEIRQFEPCEFSLLLLSSNLNGAAAREEWTCTWQFTPPTRPVGRSGKTGLTEAVLYEDGWDVMHYFQQADTYKLEITLTRAADGAKFSVQPNDSFTGEIRVLPERRRRFKRVLKYLLTGQFSAAYYEWSKGKIGATWVFEGWRLLMALFIALLGLLAGAKEQLLKLDLVPALIAIFLIGFGADQVKNLLTQRPAASDTATQR